MYIRFAALLSTTALAVVAAASPSVLEARSGGTSQCNTGPIQCCLSTYYLSDYSSLFGYLGVTLPDIPGLVGLGCAPVTVTGTGTGAVCGQQPVCCADNTYNGFINFGCNPITINA